MQLRTLVLVFCLIPGDATGNQNHAMSTVTPVQKVIQMLTEMMEKGKKEKQDEEVRFAKFKRFVEMTSADKKRDIEKANQEIEQLVADINKATTDAAQLGSEVEELEGSINGWETDEKALTGVREKERADFKLVQKDYTESLDAIDRAIAVLKSRSADIPQAALLSLKKVADKSNRFPEHAKRVLASYLQSGAEAMLVAPEANAYESQSGGVITMLEKLKKKFFKELSAVEKEEMNKKHAYEMEMQALHGSIEEAKKQRDEKSAMKARRLGDAAKAKTDLADTTAARDEDEKYLSDLITLAKQKSSDYETRQQLRAGEIEAIAKAIEILSSPAVSGNADKHLPGALLQGVHHHTALAQLRSGSQSPQQRKAVSFLTERAKSSKSQLLSVIAQRVAEDPFAKVKKMIKDLIVKLMEQASDEADHKEYCDTELSSNKQTRDDLTAQATDLQAQIDEFTSIATKMGKDMAQLSDQIAELDATMLKATEEREVEKAKNEETIADAKEASVAVSQALKVLKDFYEKAATSTAFAQQSPAQDVPETFDEPYRGNQDAKGGVVGMLEVIASDFARLEADTTSAENTAQQEYDKLIADSKEDKEAKLKERFEKELKKREAENNLGFRTKDLEMTNEELTAALDYYEKLKPACVDSGLSYADRVARRKEEIVSLQEALRILSGEELA